MDPSDLNYLFFLKASLFCLLELLLFATAGAPILALAAECSARFGKRPILDKHAAHAASMGMLIALCTLPFTAGGWITIGLKKTPVSLLMSGPIFILAAGLFYSALLLLVIYRTSWSKMKQSKGAHMFLGLLAGLCALASIFVLLLIKRALLLYGEIILADSSLTSLLQSFKSMPANSPLWFFLLQAAALSVASAGGLLLLYLLLRRNKDDYGRDYYNLSANRAAKWAAGASLLNILAMSWLSVALPLRINVSPWLNPQAQALAGSALAALIACGFWAAIAWSANPMRRKPSMFLGVFFLFLSLVAQGAFYRLMGFI